MARLRHEIQQDRARALRGVRQQKRRRRLRDAKICAPRSVGVCAVIDPVLDHESRLALSGRV
jgi:hypothetical protein